MNIASATAFQRINLKAVKRSHLLPVLIGWVLRGTLLLGIGLVFGWPRAVAAGEFVNTGSLNMARVGHTSTLLPNGEVLVAGGEEGTTAIASAELYDPSSGTWTTTGSLATPRRSHTATLLPSGEVLVAGGLDANNFFVVAAELYDPASGTWRTTGSLGTPRFAATATLLSSGKVLVAGGSNPSLADPSLKSSELYDPANGTWTATGSLGAGRSLHTAMLLPNGLVLAAGGTDGTNSVFSPVASTELYDPLSGSWSFTGSLVTARDSHTATLLPDGKVLVAGGFGSASDLASAELYDPTSGTWVVTGSMSNVRADHTATLLPDGQVLVAGSNFNPALASAELYDAANGTWSATGSLNNGRFAHTATLLNNGDVLVAGGANGPGTDIASAELYELGPPVIISPLAATGIIGQLFVYQFEASGATSLSVTGLPSGLSFDTTLSAIVGSSQVTGTFDVALSATNASGTTTATLTLTISPVPASGPVIISSTGVTGRTGQPFTFQVITTGASSSARLSATGVPPGLSVDSVTGLISGIVLVDGSSAVTLTVTDGSLTTTSTVQLTFISDLTVPVIISSNTAFLVPGQAFSYTIVAPSADTSDPVSYQQFGTLPSGLTFDPTQGIISGIFTGNLANRPQPQLSGGIVSNVQLFASNSHGTGTIQLVFFIAPSGAVNISTRLDVGLTNDVLIGGFIVTGNAPKKVIVRAIGPSLPVVGKLADPTLELHDSNGLLGSNDNWRDTQEQEIIASTVPPSNDLESAIVAILAPLDPMVPGSGAYTVIVSGKNSSTGVALVEVYDLGTASLDVSSEAKLANISTRGHVQTADNVMIGGFIVGGTGSSNILVRAIGPELTAQGVAGALQDTTLDLYDGTGTLLTSNDDWESDQKQQIIDTTIPPTDPRESAIVATLIPGNYTAIVRGKNDTTGVALVESYVLP